MKEIKFRAWDRELKRMLYQDKDFAYIRTDGIVVVCEGIKSPNLNVELMQYCGEKDKNKKEIYEGDILKHISFAENKRHEMTVIVGAEDCPFIDLGFLFETDNVTGKKPINEVLGNIYENPELITKIKY